MASVKFSKHSSTSDESILDGSRSWTLPDDLSQDYPEDVIKFISKYQITVEEIIKNAYYFSRRTGRLWRIFHTGSNQHLRECLRGSISAAEARRIYVALSGPKSLFFGNKEETFAYSGTERPSKQLVFTEDSLSAIKVGRVTHALPLFGTSISMSKIGKVADNYSEFVVWLDRDKFREAWEIAIKFKWLNKSTKVILTPLDPKCYNEDEIKGFLNGS